MLKKKDKECVMLVSEDVLMADWDDEADNRWDFI